MQSFLVLEVFECEGYKCDEIAYVQGEPSVTGRLMISCNSDDTKKCFKKSNTTYLIVTLLYDP